MPPRQLEPGLRARAVFQNSWSRWLAVWLLATTLAVYFGSQTFWASRYNHDTSASWGTILSWNLVDFYLWAVLAPLVFWLCRSFHHERAGWAGMAWRQLTCAVAVSLAHSALATLIQGALAAWTRGTPLIFWPSFSRMLVYRFQINVFLYAVLAGFWHAFDYHRRFQERRLQAAELEASLSQARLLALQAQLHPHFLFNTLQAIAELVHIDVSAAETVTLQLSELLRRTLQTGGAQQVSLAEEIEFLKTYLAIEQTRLQDRLSVRFEIDPAALDAVIPALLLQPLVENAVRHGVAAVPGPGSVSIRAHRENETLRLEIADSGPGLRAPAGGEAGHGIGLGNTRERLRRIYGKEHRFELVNGRGLSVRICLPFRAATLPLAAVLAG